MDLKQTLKAKAPLAFAVLLLALFPLLLLATRSVVLFVKVMIMNLLSLGAALGFVVAIFQEGKLESLLGYQSQDALVIILPVVMTMGCIGLLTDYGLFLLMRIREAREAGHPDSTAISIGLERTGPTITAAAALFSLGVLPFATSEIVFVKEIAVGIVVAVLIDAFLVRPLLVPSLMKILGRWNWWPSKDLMRASAGFDTVVRHRGDRQSA
jgi:RND superfamily putative drug exporter